MTAPDDTTPPGWEAPLPCVDGHVIRRTITEITMESGSDEQEIAACLRAAWLESREDAAPLIAAELRRLAEAIRGKTEDMHPHHPADMLDARADELDPPTVG